MHDSDSTISNFQHSPVAQLVAEHDLILKILSAFETWAGTLANQSTDDRLGLRRFLRFFNEYADGCHHLKEERFLFASMTRDGSSEASGPVEAMTADHEESRTLIARLERFAAQEDAWTNRDKDDIRANITKYVSLYRAHIEQENTILYPLADTGLPQATWQDIAGSFDGLREELECAGAVDELADLAQLLLN